MLKQLKKCFKFSIEINRNVEEDLKETRRLITKYPEKHLLSTALINRPDQNEAKILQKEINLSIASDDQVENIKQPRTYDYQINQQKYRNFVEKNPHGIIDNFIKIYTLKGKVHIFDFKGVKFILAGSDFSKVPNKNIYKLLRYSNPDAILLQVRPDQVLKNFNLFVPKKNQENKMIIQSNYEQKQKPQFSSSAYFSQLVWTPSQIMPNNRLRKQIQVELRNSNIFVKDIVQQDFPLFKSYELKERLTLENIATACLFGETNGNIPIILGDLPEQVFRESIANSYTLPQLQNIFKEACFALGASPDIIPHTPLNMGNFMFPEIFLRKSDEYMSTIIEYLATKKQYKRVFCLLGQAQSDAINELLEKRKVHTFEQELQIPGVVPSLIKDLTQVFNLSYCIIISCEDLVERHAILDIMFHGQEIYKDFSQKKIFYLFNFFTVNVIRKYADPQKIDKDRENQMKYLHLEMLKKYQLEYNKQYKLGVQELQNEFISKSGIISEIKNK